MAKVSKSKTNDVYAEQVSSARNAYDSSIKNSQQGRSPLHTQTQENLTAETVYEFYSQHLFPAILASLPLLWHRFLADAGAWLMVVSSKVRDFLLPAWAEHRQEQWTLAPNFVDLWEKTLQQSCSSHSSVAEFMLNHFDTNGDGHISPSELINMTEIISRLQNPPTQTFWAWFSREWPLMDWKVGVFLWRSFGGLLLLLAFLSVVPGRLHGWSGKLLRWPILFLTYTLIAVELMVYTVVRIVIRTAELLIATPKHRALRRKMANAKSYEQWYQYAAALDISQRRDKWQRTVNDNTSCRYNWALIRQLMDDLRNARDKHDILMAEAVLQQCTRKNVGGIMSEDLFSYTNTGEPKYIVKEFIEEVTITLRWITDESLRMPKATVKSEELAKLSYQKNLERKVQASKDKIWKSVLSWATLSFGADEYKFTYQDQNQILTNDAAATPRNRAGSELTLGSDVTNDSVPQALPHFHKEQLIAFLKRARAAYGRTALCLSGGAMMGLYHFGHLQGLMETDCLPHIISGTSAGSVIGAIVCTRTDEELRRDMTPEVVGPKMKCFERPWPERIKSIWKHGHMFSNEEWMKMIKWFTCGDMTFEEAYKKTGRIFCITLASTTKKAPPVLLNYITAPKVTIASAVIASAAVPGFVKPARLEVKHADGTVCSAGDETYFDGSIEHDIPVNGLAEQLNCQFLIAAQCNPHVVPFFFNAKGGVGSPSRWRSDEQEASWRGGFLLAALAMYLLNDIKAKFRFVHEVEAAVGFTSSMFAQEFVGSTTIVPQVQLWDFFTLFCDPSPESLHRYFHVGSVAAYQHAAMIRLHYRIADTIDECLEKLGAGERRWKTKVKPSRRASFEINQKISNKLAHFHCKSPFHSESMPEIITAALNERLADSDSTSMSEGSYY